MGLYSPRSAFVKLSRRQVKMRKTKPASPLAEGGTFLLFDLPRELPCLSKVVLPADQWAKSRRLSGSLLTLFSLWSRPEIEHELSSQYKST